MRRNVVLTKPSVKWKKGKKKKQSQKDKNKIFYGDYLYDSIFVLCEEMYTVPTKQIVKWKKGKKNKAKKIKTGHSMMIL